MPPQQPSASWRSRIQRSSAAQRALAQRAERAPLVGVQRAVERGERPPHGIGDRSATAAAARAQLVERRTGARAPAGSAPTTVSATTVCRAQQAKS